MTAQQLRDLMSHQQVEKSHKERLDNIYAIIEDAAKQGNYRVMFKEPLALWEEADLLKNGYAVDKDSSFIDVSWYPIKGL